MIIFSSIFAIIFFLLISSSASDSNDFSNLNIIVTRGNNSETLPLSTLDNALTTSSFYDPTLKTVLYFFGWKVSYTLDPTVRQVQQAFETIGGYNFLVADWSAYNKGNFITVGNSLNGIADAFGAKLAKMVSSGKISLANWHFIGHSLGSHLAGGKARKIRSTATIVPRVTGLDPPGILIYPPSILLFFYKGLTASDAASVDIIHTDRKFGGTTYSVGTVDFWVNDADNPQPGCPNSLPVTLFDLLDNNVPLQNYCSHRRCIDLFIESILVDQNKKAFPAVKCSSFQLNCAGYVCSQFDMSTINYLGLYATSSKPCNFFLKTNAVLPYNTGASGY